VYHANYFKFMWRGREALLFGHRHDSFDEWGWDTASVVAIDNCKFASSAVLGDNGRGLSLAHTRPRGV
jgi:acyl-CoA thioesterase FadM